MTVASRSRAPSLPILCQGHHSSTTILQASTIHPKIIPLTLSQGLILLTWMIAACFRQEEHLQGSIQFEVLETLLVSHHLMTLIHLVPWVHSSQTTKHQNIQTPLVHQIISNLARASHPGENLMVGVHFSKLMLCHDIYTYTWNFGGSLWVWAWWSTDWFVIIFSLQTKRLA